MGHERAEFAEFYKTSWEPCLRAVSISQADQHLAEDQLSEAFARAWVSWRVVRRHPAPRAWVVRTALNVGVSWWRRRRREVELTDHNAGVAVNLAGSGPAGDGVDEGLINALRCLPLREREVIALRLLLDLDTKTTAKHLGIAPGTVRAHLSRAVAALRNEIGPHEAVDQTRTTDETMEVKECTTATK